MMRVHNSSMVSRSRAILAACLAATAMFAGGQSEAYPSGWTPMVDTRTLNGWKEVAFDGRGKVTIENGVIRLGRGRSTGIAWTGDFPRSNYEIRFEAARLDGNDFFAAIIFPVKDSHCSWINGGWDGTVSGLSNLDGYDASENETSSTREFEKGRWYAFRLRVTSSRIQGWVDDNMVLDLDITGRKLELRFDDTDLCKPLGFTSYGTTGGLRKIEYRRLGAE